MSRVAHPKPPICALKLSNRRRQPAARSTAMASSGWGMPIRAWVLSLGCCSTALTTRYPGSEHSDDRLVQMGRKTEWVELAPGQYTGSGQRELATDSADYGLLNVREVRLAAVE